MILIGLTPGWSGRVRERRIQDSMSAAPGIQTVNEHLKRPIGGRWKRAKWKKKKKNGGKWSVVAAVIQAGRREKLGAESWQSVVGDPSRCASTKGFRGLRLPLPHPSANDTKRLPRTAVDDPVSTAPSRRARGLRIMAAVVEAHYF